MIGEAADAQPPLAPRRADVPLMALQELQDISKETARKLHPVWDEMGLSEDERKLQLQSLVQAVTSVFEQKVVDELALRDEYKNAAQLLEEEIDECSRLVGMERQYFPHKDEGNLMLKLPWLRSHLEQFKAVKEERLGKLTEMQRKLKEIWAELGHDEVEDLLRLDGFLTEEGMDEYESRLVTIQHERTRRIAAVQETIRDINALFEELDFEIETDLDHAIVQGGEAIGIDLKAVSVLSKRARELTDEKITRTEKLKLLGMRIQPLWELLNIDTEERQQFFMQNRGLGISVIEQCEHELDRLMELKQVRMGDLIHEAQEKIQALWDELQYDDEQREAFTQQHMMGPICEETLERHEQEIEALSQQAELFRPILKLIEKYFQLCEDRIKYEDRIKDSTRLLSRRGGNALREEEQVRLRVEKGIPRVIERVRATVKAYEDSHGPFVLNGMRFLETMEANEKAHLDKLAQEKQAKQRAKQQDQGSHRTPHRTPRKAGASLASSHSRTPLSARNDGAL